jgi:hypothetical protein
MRAGTRNPRLRFHSLLYTIFAAVLTSIALLCGSAVAATTTHYIVANGLGLDDGYACLSSAGPGLCSASQTFDVASTFGITGSFTFDDGAGTIDVDITLATASMPGTHDGVDEIVFTNVNYTVAGMSAFSPGAGQLFGVSATAGSITGFYEQKSGGANVVGPDAIDPMSSIFSAFSCSGLGGVGLCGLTVGAGSRDFNLDVGTTGSGDPSDFVHTFNFNVVPEPTTGALFGLGILALGIRRIGRRR